MKRLVVSVLAATALLSPAANAAAVCLRDQDIKDTQSPDGRTLIVTMRDGKVWKNNLQTPCPGLRFNGFSWALHQPALICDDTQALRVIDSGEVCMIGKFSPQRSATP
jgi:hypothetical protein